MKGGRLYIVILFVLLILIFFYELNSPHVFVWNATYDKNDKEPLGCYVFDDVVSSSVKDYHIINSTFFQIAEDTTAKPKSFLLMEDYLSFEELDINCMLELVHKGNKVMLCIENFPYKLEDTLQFTSVYTYYSPIGSHINHNQKIKRDSIFFGTDSKHPTHSYGVLPRVHSIYLSRIQEETKGAEEKEDPKLIKYKKMNCDSSQTIVRDDEGRALAMRLFIEKGELILVSTPYMFTNFGILDNDNADYVFRLLSYLNDRPIVRIEAYGEHSEESRSPLRYITKEPPLRWALYVGLILLLLFMFFSTRRRQRVIPIMDTPPNRTLGFLQLISNLYYQEHNNGEIMKMKFTYFCAEVKRLIGIDLQEGTLDDSVFQRLSEKTGIDSNIIRKSIKNIQMATYTSDASDEQLKNYINALNDIMKALKS